MNAFRRMLREALSDDACRQLYNHARLVMLLQAPQPELAAYSPDSYWFHVSAGNLQSDLYHFAFLPLLHDNSTRKHIAEQFDSYALQAYPMDTVTGSSCIDWDAIDQLIQSGIKWEACFFGLSCSPRRVESRFLPKDILVQQLEPPLRIQFTTEDIIKKNRARKQPGKDPPLRGAVASHQRQEFLEEERKFKRR